MKQRISNFIKPLSKTDWIKLTVFVLLSTLFTTSYGFTRLIIASWFSDIFPPDYPSNSFFKIPSLAWLTAEFILAVILAILTVACVSKLRVWVLSIPVQMVLCFAFYFLNSYNSSVTLQLNSVAVIIILIAQVLIVQAIGVAIGLGIRNLACKIQAHKQPIPA